MFLVGDVLFSRHIGYNASCFRYGNGKESIAHALLWCPIIKSD